MVAPGPDADQINTILTVATRVPDDGKLTPWRFIVFEGAARQRADAIIAKAFADKNPQADAERLAFESSKLSRAPVVIAVVEGGTAPEDSGMGAGAVGWRCAMNLVTAAHAMGFTTQWLTDWFVFDRRCTVLASATMNTSPVSSMSARAASPPKRPRPPVAES